MSITTRGWGGSGTVSIAGWGGRAPTPPTPPPYIPKSGGSGGAAGPRSYPWQCLDPCEFEELLRNWGLTIEEVFPDVPDEELPPKARKRRQECRYEWMDPEPECDPYCPAPPKPRIRRLTAKEVLEAALGDVRNPIPAKLKPGVRVVLGAAGIFTIYRGIKKVAQGNLADLVMGGILLNSGLTASTVAIEGIPPPPKLPKRPRPPRKPRRR